MTIAPSSRSSGSAYSDESSPAFPASTLTTSLEGDVPKDDLGDSDFEDDLASPRRRCSTLPVCLRREWRSFSPRQPVPPLTAFPSLAVNDILNCFPSPPSPSTSYKKLYISTTTRASQRGCADEVMDEADECVDWVKWLDEWWRIQDVGEVKQEVVRGGRRARKESLPAGRGQT